MIRRMYGVEDDVDGWRIRMEGGMRNEGGRKAEVLSEMAGRRANMAGSCGKKVGEKVGQKANNGGKTIWRRKVAGRERSTRAS